jgi:AcrR family transcriptional regulator
MTSEYHQVIDSQHIQWRSPHPSPGIAVSDIGDVFDVAAELIAERGMARFSMQDLADRVGIAKPTLYAYVGNKASLLEGIFDRVLAYAESMLAEAQVQESSEAKLATLIRLWTRGSVLDVAYYRVYFGYEHELADQAHKRVRRRVAALVASIRDLVIEGQASGSFESKLDPAVVAFAIVWMCTSTGSWFSEGGDLTWEAVADQYIALVGGGLIKRSATSGSKRAR